MGGKDVVALGECLIDFVCAKGEEGKIHMEGNAGGAPANVLSMAALLGRATAFIGKVGQDSFGDFIKLCIAQSGVDISAMATGSEPTTLAMVTLSPSGDRSFSFYRNGTADVMLRREEVDSELVKNCKIFHFGSVSMTAAPASDTTLEAARTAKKAGVKISFDPNYRPLLWGGEAQAVQAMKQGLHIADYVKVSDEEAALLTGFPEPEKAARALWEEYDLELLAVTLGAKGCLGIMAGDVVSLPTYDVKSVDTTGAGDAFWGAMLHRLLEGGRAAGKDALEDYIRYANAAGSLATTKLGAIAAQPTEKEILSCMAEAPMLYI